ncbi:hypothetical protein ACVIHH_008321 [Bradyrhizobium sp. USDA 4518]
MALPLARMKQDKGGRSVGLAGDTLRGFRGQKKQPTFSTVVWLHDLAPNITNGNTMP